MLQDGGTLQTQRAILREIGFRLIWKGEDRNKGVEGPEKSVRPMSWTLSLKAVDLAAALAAIDHVRKNPELQLK